MIEAPKSGPLRPAGPSQEDNAPVNVDAILLSILGRGGERFGMVAAVLRGERIIAQGAAGVRKRGTAERITLDNQFHLGSCTKAMTATLVAMLVEEGKLNWTTTLGELFADTVKSMHPAWEKVTLRQVLAHRAGLPFEPDGLNPVFSTFRELMRPPRARLGTLPQQRLEIARQALSRPPRIPPDTKYWYSNVGYVLAGAVLEQLTGRAWEELMRERLFQPLGISTGGFGPPGTADKTEQAWGHSPVLGKPLDPRSPAAELELFFGPAGLAHMTVTSWAKGTQPGDTGRRLWHAGSNGRWNAGVVIAPEIDFAVLVACNRGWLGIAAWKTRQTLKALIQAFAPKRTS